MLEMVCMLPINHCTLTWPLTSFFLFWGGAQVTQASSSGKRCHVTDYASDQALSAQHKDWSFTFVTLLNKCSCLNHTWISYFCSVLMPRLLLSEATVHFWWEYLLLSPKCWTIHITALCLALNGVSREPSRKMGRCFQLKHVRSNAFTTEVWWKSRSTSYAFNALSWRAEWTYI